MSTFAFTYNEYLVDENGDYVLTDPLDPQSRIILATRSLSVNGDYRPIGGGLRRKLNNRPVLSFRVKHFDSTDQWTLSVNRDTFIGIYPSQDAAIGVLYGLMTFHDGSDDTFAAFLEDSINTRGSEIDSAYNVMTFATSTTETTVSVSGYDAAQALTDSGAPNDTGGYWLGYQLSSDGITWDAVNVGNVIGATLTGDADQTRTSVGPTIWDAIAENQYYRGVLMVADAGLTFHVAAFSATGWKDEVDETDISALTMTISGSPTAGDAVFLGSSAYSVVDESGAVLDPGETISYTYMWYREIPTLTGIDVDPPSGGTAPTINTAGASATDPTVGDTVSVTGVTYSGTEPVTIAYDWLVDAVSSGITTSSFDTSSLSGGEALTCTVTATNTYGSDSTSVNFGTVAAAAEWSLTADGIFRVDGWNSAEPTGTTTELTSSVAYISPTQGFYSDIPRGRYYTTADYPTWISIWSLTASSWIGAFEYATNFGTTAPNIVVRWGSSSVMTTGDNYIVIYHTTDPSFSAGWAPYDGPTS